MTRQIASGKLAGNGDLVASSGDDWDWRLSIADVGNAGDFSVFDGMTRILTLIQGDGLVISIDGVEQRLERYTPLCFDGGSATSATLASGPIRDLNLMTRDGTVNGDVAIVGLSRERPQQLSGGQFGILLQGRARLSAGPAPAQDLERHDTIVGGGEPGTALTGDGYLAVLSVDPA